MKRTPIPKTVRFEVFKRDSFKCQYCGKSAPDVVLEIDHIKPVSKGGTNDIMNLVTACRDCNRGKTNRELSDKTTVQMQKKQLDELQDRREQLEMLVMWKEELAHETELEVDAINRMLAAETGSKLTDEGLTEARRLIKRFGFNEVSLALDIALNHYYHALGYDAWYAWDKVGGICYNRKKAREAENA